MADLTGMDWLKSEMERRQKYSTPSDAPTDVKTAENVAPTSATPAKGAPPTLLSTLADQLRAPKLALGLEKPQDWQDYVRMAGIEVPLTAMGGSVAKNLVSGVPKLAAAAGRVLTNTGLGAAKGATSEEGSALGRGAWSAATSALGEALMGVIGKALAPLAKPDQVLKAVKDYVSAGPSGPANAQMIDAWLSRIASAGDPGTRAIVVQRALAALRSDPEIGPQMTALIRAHVVNPTVGVKGLGVSVAPGVSKAANAAQGVAGNDMTRAAVDTAMADTPLGIAAVSALPSLNPMGMVRGALR